MLLFLLGLSIQFGIVGDNLECTLVLPAKYRAHIEGLVGNYNEDPTDDLFNRETNQIISTASTYNITTMNYDLAILNACRSCKFQQIISNRFCKNMLNLGRVPGDMTSDNGIPILPRTLVEWYYNNASDFLATLNPLLSQTVVNRTCQGNFECIHDYLIQINAFTSSATASALGTIQESRTALGKICMKQLFVLLRICFTFV